MFMSSRKDFFSSYFLTVQINDLSKFETALETITGVEGITIESTEFTVSDLFSRKEDIVDSAILAARKKAERYANLLEFQLNGVAYFEVMELKENNDDPYSNIRGGRNNEVNYSVGRGSVNKIPVIDNYNQIEVTCRVKVIYHIKQIEND